MRDRPLFEVFLRLFRISRLYNSSIESLTIPNTTPVSWNLGFRRNLNDEQALEVSASLIWSKESVW